MCNTAHNGKSGFRRQFKENLQKILMLLLFAKPKTKCTELPEIRAE